jgi:hypothetical protein
LTTGSDGSGYGVFGRRYHSAGVAQGSDFLVNTYATDNQRDAAVAADGSKFVVVWDSHKQDGSTFGVFGQRYNMIVPVQLLDFGIEYVTAHHRRHVRALSSRASEFARDAHRRRLLSASTGGRTWGSEGERAPERVRLGSGRSPRASAVATMNEPIAAPAVANLTRTLCDFETQDLMAAEHAYIS